MTITAPAITCFLIRFSDFFSSFCNCPVAFLWFSIVLLWLSHGLTTMSLWLSILGDCSGPKR